MKSRTVTVWEGEDCGPIDWSHPIAKDMPEIWREAEKDPDAFELVEDFVTRQIWGICMYDGWPYWKPTPALRVSGTLGSGEWKFFNSYGVRPSSIRRKASADTHPKGGDVKQAPSPMSGAVSEAETPQKDAR